MSASNNHTHQFSYALNQTAPVDISFANPNYLEQSLSQDQPIQMNLKSLKYSQENFQPQMKNTEELELEKAESEKRTILKAKLKQQRLYKKILQTQSPINGTGQGFDCTASQNKKKKTSYVQALLEKSKRFLDQNEDKEELLKSARQIMQKNQAQKMLQKRKTLTVSTPFQLRTMKRVRLDIDEEKGIEKEEYEPLWAQIKKNFRLRDSDNKNQNERGKIRDLTKPQSPNLQTLERMKLKGEFHIASADKAQDCQHHSDFKAKPFNKKVFENPFVPKIEKKAIITFEEFNLSKSNTKLAKKSLDDYIDNKENATQNIFRAKSLDKKLFEKKDISPISEVKPKKLTEISPFNFKTEERQGLRQIDDNSSCQDQNSTNFKAREMPKYKFFEVKHDIKKQISFQEFKLATQQRQSKKRSNSIDENEQDKKSNEFHALPMPDFSNLKPKTCIKRQATQALELKPFQLLSDARGREKQIKFESLVEQERRHAQEQSRFKAREFRKVDSSANKDGYSDTSSMNYLSAAKRTPKAVTVTKDIRLHSMARSQSRDDYNRKLREKEHEMQVREISLTKQKMKEMDDEIKKIRDMQVFKASGIRKYKPLDGSKVPEKPLTIPQMPKLSTFERAQLKEETH